MMVSSLVDHCYTEDKQTMVVHTGSFTTHLIHVGMMKTSRYSAEHVHDSYTIYTYVYANVTYM